MMIMEKGNKNALMRICILLLVILAGVNIEIRAQDKQIKVSGIVVDKSNDPIIGAIISVVGSTNAKGAVTDQNGKFTITATSNSILKVSFLGFVTQNINIRNN